MNADPNQAKTTATCIQKTFVQPLSLKIAPILRQRKNSATNSIITRAVARSAQGRRGSEETSGSCALVSRRRAISTFMSGSSRTSVELFSAEQQPEEIAVGKSRIDTLSHDDE